MEEATQKKDVAEEKRPSLAQASTDLAALKKQVENLQNAAFLCTAIRPENPNYLGIVCANKIFADIFDRDLEYVIGRSYDLLFDNIDVSYASDDQLEYIRLTKSIKERQDASVLMKLDSYIDGKFQVAKFKINFKPINDEKLDKFYAIFSFEKISQEIGEKEEEKTQHQILIKNLERTLNHEKLLREISYMVISDNAVKDIAQKIAELLCKNLKVDRCIVHDRKNKRSSFILEYCNSDSVKKVLDDKKEKIEKYIEFHHEFYQKHKNTENKKNNDIFVIKDVKSDHIFEKMKDFFEEYNVASQVVAITSLDSNANGGIYLHLSDKRSLTIDEVELIESIADQLSIAIDRSYSIEKVMVANHNLLKKTLELKEAIKKEKEMRKMQTEFVALVSHEFKTPLQIIDSTRELLMRKAKSLNITDESFLKYLDRIKSGIQRMTGLIDSTLNLAKLENNESEIQINKQPFNLHDLIKDIIDKTSNLAVKKNIKIEMILCENMTDINADQKLLDHCFTNIISNAIKYSNENTTVKITTKSTKDKVAVQVQDQGIGIPKEDIANIGKKFFRAKNTLSVSGTGIGIYLTKYFVELHKGKIIIDSKLNKGTTFTTILPR